MGTMYAIANLVHERLFGHLGHLTSHAISAVDAGVSVTALDLVSTILLPDHYEGAYIYINSASGAAPELETQQVTQYDRANGLLVYANTFSAEPAIADTFQIYPGMHPQRIRDFILQALRAGTKGVVTSLTDDLSATQTALPDLYAAEGALYFCRLAQARKLTGKERQDVLVLAHQNLEDFRRLVSPIYGEINLGRRDPVEGKMPTERELLSRF